jgi:hypothetical protein
MSKTGEQGFDSNIKELFAVADTKMNKKCSISSGADEGNRRQCICLHGKDGLTSTEVPADGRSGNACSIFLLADSLHRREA